MKKINDRFVAGAIAGLGANLVKKSIEYTTEWLGVNKITGCKKAAGFFLPSRKVNTPKGKFIGLISDFTIASLLGISTTYLMTFTGKDNYKFKGLAIGDISWNFMHGILGNAMGASRVKSSDPNSHITSMIAHAAFGITETYLLTKIAHPSLFEPPLQESLKPKPQNKLENYNS